MSATKPVAVLVAAMGGEGGGVLADWLVSAATALDFPVQSTSVPGVAQRTGATTYYIEIFPVARGELAGRVPVLSLTPTPANVDLVAASELVEAGRVLQGGFVHPERTTLVASTHREYAVSEKTAMGDGRYDSGRVLEAARGRSRSAILFDMRALAQRHGTVINTVVFGAMAGSGVLPFPRAACEDAIRASGKSVQASLRGFAAGYEIASRMSAGEAVEPPARQDVEASSPRLVDASRARIDALDERVRALVAEGVAQTTDYQGPAYAALYLDRVEALHARERGSAPSPTFEVTRETARYLALWMSYEDVIRVADLKTRRERLQRVRAEVGARDGEPLRLTEYLKPGLEEICSILPPAAGAWLQRRLAHRAQGLSVGLHMRTDTVGGFVLLCVLRSLRPWRPRTSRYAHEQAMIVRWLAAIAAALDLSARLAHELALVGNLVKGYGETSARGHRNLAAILDDVQAELARADVSPDACADRVKAAREAALADPEGRALARTLDLPPPEVKSHPIRIVRRPSG